MQCNLKFIIFLLLIKGISLSLYCQPDEDITIKEPEQTKNGTHYWAKIKGVAEPIYIGWETDYGSNMGISNITKDTHKNRCRKISLKMIDSIYLYNTKLSNIDKVWMYVMHVVSKGEGEYFNTINTYDDANFTFGPFQFAAHVPDNEPSDFGYFLEYLKHVIRTDKNTFPNLKINRDSLICDKYNRILEDKDENLMLRKWFNNNFMRIDNDELKNIARFANFINNDTEQEYMIEFTYQRLVERFKQIDKKLIKYHYISGLNELPAEHCAIIFDILHHGRSNYEAISKILNETISKGRYSLAIDRLIDINKESKWNARRENLRLTINEFKKRNDKLQNYKYNIHSLNFKRVY